MKSEQLEFLISQYLDGTLSSEEKLRLEQVFADDPAARELLDQHRTLDRALRACGRVPDVNWNRLAETISSRAAAEMIPTSDAFPAEESIDQETEYALTRLLDGELPAEEQATVEQRLASDPAARRALAQHRALDVLLKHAMPLPEVNWDRLHQGLTLAIREEEAAPASYPIFKRFLHHAPRLAVAAGLLIALGIAALIYTGRSPVAPASPGYVIDARDPGATPAPRLLGQPVLQVAFGPSGDDAATDFESDASGVVVLSQTFNLQITRAVNEPRDLDVAPF